jgi:hypothetical protein
MRNIIIGILCILVIGHIWLYISDRKTHTIYTSAIDAKMDSLEKRDSIRTILSAMLIMGYRVDSSRIADIEMSVVQRIPEIKATIKRKYDEKRNHIDTMSADEQIRYMSDWLSKDTTTR